MSEEDRIIDNSSENSTKGNKRMIPTEVGTEGLPKRPRMNLWEHTKGSKTLSKDDVAAVNSEDSASNISSDESETDADASLEELAASICGLISTEYSMDELENFPWLSNMSEAFKSVYLHVRNKACMLWLKDPRNQLTEKNLVNNLNNTSSDKYFQDIIAAKLCSFNRTNDDNGQKSQSRLNTIDRVVLKKYDIDSITKDSNYKDNISKIGVLVIGFLERYGYINFGNFIKHADSYTNGSLCREGNPLQVLIVGAGLSGIIAAMQLEYFGCKVLVLEAQDTAGGRLKTFQKDKVNIDVSPFTITGINNPVNQLIKQAGLSVGIFNAEIDVVSNEGDPISKDCVCRIECELNRLLLAANDICQKFCFNEVALPQNSNQNNQQSSTDSQIAPVLHDTVTTTKKSNQSTSPSNQSVLPYKTINSATITMGEMLTSLLNLQMNHCRQLKKNSNDLLLKLLDRLKTVLEELNKHRNDITVAHDKWWAAGEELRKIKSKNSTTASNNSGGNQDGGDGNVGGASGVTGGDDDDEDDDDDDDDECDEEAVVDEENLFNNTNKVTLLNPELQMNINMALSEYRRTYQKCSAYFDEAVKLRKMIRLINEYDPASMMLDEQDLQIMDLFLSNLEMRVGTDLNNLSVQYFNSHQCHSELASGEIYIKKGYQALINSMIKKSNAYQMNTTVKDINYCEDTVRITAINKALSEEDPVHYEGHIVLSALPLGVLKQVIQYPEGPNSPRFVPSLPDWKLRAIENLGFGNLNKVVMCFKESFWGPSKNKIFAQLKTSREERNIFPQFYALSERNKKSDSHHNGGYIGGGGMNGTNGSDLESETCSDIDDGTESNTGDNKGAAIVVGAIYGSAASPQSNEDDNDDVVGKMALDSLRSIFKKKKVTVPEPTSIHVIRWSSDPYFGGSITFLSDAAGPQDIQAVAAPLSTDTVSSSALNNPNVASSRTRRGSTVAAMTDTSNLVTIATPQNNPVTSSATNNTNCNNSTRLFFTGEHTHAQCGSIQAQMMSGLKSATQIVKAHFPHWPNAINRMPANLQFRR